MQSAGIQNKGVGQIVKPQLLLKSLVEIDKTLRKILFQRRYIG